MAFTRKAAPKKTAASYARKKQAEAQEVEEVVEEVEEIEGGEEIEGDYVEEADEPAPAPAPRAFRRSAPVPAPAPRGYNQPTQSAPQGEGNGSIRLTGLFAGKREGCFSGRLRAEDAANLASLLSEAQATNQEVVFFLWENAPNPQRPNSAPFNLVANLSVPKAKKPWGGNRGGFGQRQGGNYGGNFGGQNRGFRRY